VILDRNIDRIMLIIITNILIITFAFSSCAKPFTNNSKITGYNLTRPDTTFILPDILMEISGLTEIDTTSFACVQDENGILFIYDAVKNKIKKQYPFHINGDYEGIARVEKTIYVLRSDGTLFEISNYEAPDFKIRSYPTGIPANNNEGLCYDQDNNRLLIACKGKIGKGSQYKDKRVIYSFDLTTKTLSKEPVYDFDLEIIKQSAMTKKINLPLLIRKKGKQRTEPIIKFRTSAIAIHPLMKKLYLLSAIDHLLFTFDMKGNIEHIEQLNPDLFNKAEGITFFKNGDMLITNEGQDKKPTVLRFNYQKD
jgi:hypothetical protein